MGRFPNRNRFGQAKCILIFCLVSVFAVPACSEETITVNDWAAKRGRMVRTQIRDRGITASAVLKAMGKVPRHLFVPQSYRSQAYADYPLPIGEGQTISQPYIVALMTEVLDIRPRDRVLEIGTGSGYQAAVLAEMGAEVFTIEIVDSLGRRAKRLIASLKYTNVRVKIGDGYQGWSEFAPFDAVIVTCAPSHIPLPLKRQLAEGGRMVIPVGKKNEQHLVILTKEKGKVRQKEIIPVRFVPMLKKDGRAY